MLNFHGRHLFGSYFGCDPELLRSPKEIERSMEEGVAAAGATLLNTLCHSFPGGGFTIVMLLAESHASIHTYPEHGSCFVDLFTCGESCIAEEFERILKTRLRPAGSDIQILRRGLIEKTSTETEEITCTSHAKPLETSLMSDN